jgi:hypothetical protein
VLVTGLLALVAVMGDMVPKLLALHQAVGCIGDSSPARFFNSGGVSGSGAGNLPFLLNNW